MTAPAADALVLAIDLGSSGVKVGLVDAAGQLVTSTHERYGMTLIEGGGAEQDAEGWWSAIVRCVRKVISTGGVRPERVLAIGCTSQWGVIVPAGADAKPVGPAISWMDTRGAKYNQQIVSGFPSIQGYGALKLLRWIRAIGIPPTRSGVDSLSHMMFLKRDRPDVYARAHKLLEPMDYVTFRLTGRATSTRSTQFPTVLVDVRSKDPGRYHPFALGAADLDIEKLGELIAVDGRAGTLAPAVAAELGLAPQTVVLAGTPDNHTSAIGSGAVANGDAVAVLGTSGFLGVHVPNRGLDVDSFMTTMPSPLPGRHLIFGDLGNNGKVLDSWLERQAFADEPPSGDLYARLDALVSAAPPGSDGVVFLPWFNGALCPREDPAMRGGFLNLTHHTTRAHLARAVLEGICLNWRWLIGAAEKFCGQRFPLLRLAGGGARSEVWAQTMADVTGRPVHQLADPPNGNVLGMAYLLWRHLGQLELERVPSMVRIARVFEPNAAHAALFDRRFEQFLLAEKQLRPVFHALNGR